MLKKMFTFGLLLVVAVAAVLVSPKTGEAQRYYSGYGVYQPYGISHYGYYRPYFGYQRHYGSYYGYPQYYRSYYGGYYGHPGYYGTYPRYGYYPNYHVWR